MSTRTPSLSESWAEFKRALREQWAPVLDPIERLVERHPWVGIVATILLYGFIIVTVALGILVSR